MKMSDSIILRVWKDNKSSCIKLENFNLNDNAAVLKDEATKKMNATGNEIAFRGLIFEDERPVSSYGVTPGCTVHVLEKRPPPFRPESRKLSEAELKQLALSFKTLKSTRFSTSLRTALQRLSKPEILENIIAATPGLADDPVALAIVQDPELLIEMAQPETISEMAEKHPALIEATYYIAAHIYDQRMSTNADQPSSSAGYSYFLDALSDDDDDMEDSPDTDGNLPRSSSDLAINAAQLADAIATATNNVMNSTTENVTGGNQPAERSGNFGSPVITNEAFHDAIQRAFVASRLGTNNPPMPFQSDGNPPFTEQENRGNNLNQGIANMVNRWQTQLQQMHEIGLTDDVINSRALEATSGDIQAAIELIFSGVFN